MLHRVMADRAASLGIDLLWRTPVTGISADGVQLSGRKVSARWIIGADGGNSRVRRWAGLDAFRRKDCRFAFRQHFRVAPWTDRMELHWGRCGEIYVTPISSEEVCVALISHDPKLRLDEGLRAIAGIAGTAAWSRNYFYRERCAYSHIANCGACGAGMLLSSETHRGPWMRSRGKVCAWHLARRWCWRIVCGRAIWHVTSANMAGWRCGLADGPVNAHSGWAPAAAASHSAGLTKSARRFSTPAGAARRSFVAAARCTRWPESGLGAAHRIAMSKSTTCWTKRQRGCGSCLLAALS